MIATMSQLLLSITPDQLEGLVFITTLGSLIYAYREQVAVIGVAKRDGGNIKALPTSFLARIVTPVHFVAMFITPVTYLTAFTLNGFKAPQWTSIYSLPATYDEEVGPAGKIAIRLAGTVASVIVYKGMSLVFSFLSSQWHYIGLREKPKIISSGPYAWVRHPLYTGFLAQELTQAVMYWSWVPLVTLAITALALMIKIPIEEKVIEDDKIIGGEYKAYKKKVTSRVIPGIW